MDYRLTGRNSGLYQHSDDNYKRALEELQNEK